MLRSIFKGLGDAVQHETQHTAGVTRFEAVALKKTGPRMSHEQIDNDKVDICFAWKHSGVEKAFSDDRYSDKFIFAFLPPLDFICFHAFLRKYLFMETEETRQNSTCKSEFNIGFR